MQKWDLFLKPVQKKKSKKEIMENIQKWLYDIYKKKIVTFF